MGQIQRGFFLCKLYEWMIRNVFVVFFPFARYLLMLEFGISSFIALRKIPCQKTIPNSNQRSFFGPMVRDRFLPWVIQNYLIKSLYLNVY